MKCFAISTGAGIIYAWYDYDYKELLKQSVDDCETTDSAEFDLITYAIDAFSFLTAYDTLLSQNNESFCFIKCKDNFTICFQKYDQFLYVGLAQNEADQKDQIFRELGFIRKSIEFLFGPGGHAVFRTQYSEQKRKARKCINAMLESYMKLCENDNAFLLEGIEEIQQLNDRVFGYEEQISKCVGSFIKSPISKYLQYVMIFVGSKLLCYHKLSTRIANLNTRTILLIIALIHSTVHHVKAENNSVGSQKLLSELEIQDVDVDLPVDTQSISVQEEKLSKVDGDCLFDNTDAMSLASTVTAFGAQSLVSVTENNFSSQSAIDVSNKVDDSALFSDSERVSSTSLKSSSWISDYFSEENSKNNELKPSQTVPVFFATKQSPSVPCQLSFIPLSLSQNGTQAVRNEENCQIKMVLIFKARSAIAADPICAVLFWLRRLRFITENEIWPTEAKTKEMDEKLNKSFDQIFKKTKGLHKSVKETGSKLKASWQNQAQKDVKSILKSRTLDTKMQTTIRRFITTTESHLIELHNKLFPSCLSPFSRLLSETALNQIQVSTRNELLCYMDYLLFKSQQNIPITPYLTRYPGLVHFAVVLRTTLLQASIKYHDIVFAPSISKESISSGIGQALLSTLHKEFLIFLQLVNSRLVDGEQTCVYTQKSFKFVCNVKCSTLAPGDSISKKLVVSPSLFCGNYYEKCFCSHSEAGPCPYIYQLISVHFDCVSNETITLHREKLFAGLLKDLRDSSLQ